MTLAFRRSRGLIRDVRLVVTIHDAGMVSVVTHECIIIKVSRYSLFVDRLRQGRECRCGGRRRSRRGGCGGRRREARELVEACASAESDGEKKESISIKELECDAQIQEFTQIGHAWQCTRQLIVCHVPAGAFHEEKDTASETTKKNSTSRLSAAQTLAAIRQ